MAKQDTKSDRRFEPPLTFGQFLSQELRYAVADIRHKVVEEGWFGRAVTPHWGPLKREHAGIHGKPDDAAEPGGPVHGKPGTQSRRQDRPLDAGGEMPGEPKGLGMSYAELKASWGHQPDQAPDRKPEKQPEPEHGLDR